MYKPLEIATIIVNCISEFEVEKVKKQFKFLYRNKIVSKFTLFQVYNLAEIQKHKFK